VVRLVPIAILATLLLAPAVRAQEAPEAEAPPALWTPKKKPAGLSYGGRIFGTAAPDLVMKGPYEDRFLWSSGVDFRVKYKFADDARFAIGAKLRYQVRVGDTVEADAWFDLGQTYLQFRKGRFSAKLGRFVQHWGRNTLLSPLDRLNPIDYTVAFDPGGETEARIPVLAARLNLNLHPVGLEVFWLPLYQPDRLSFYGRDFSVFRPGMLEEMLPGLIPGTGAGLVDDELRRASTRVVDEITGLDPYARDGLQSYLVPNVPEEVIWNSDLGARVGLTGPGVDADFIFLWHLLDQPEIVLHEALREPLLDNRMPDSGELTRLSNPDERILQARYARSIMAGADVAVAVRGFVISGEVAFDSARILYTKRLEPYRSPDVRWAAAVRYNHGTAFAVTVELGHDILLRPREDTFLVRQHELLAAVLTTLRLFQDRLQITLAASYQVFQRDLYLHPKVVIEIDDHLAATIGVQLFQGFAEDVEPTLDSFLSYEGGVVGWFRANDHAYATIDYRF
jgi:hypothetical protein